MMCPLDPGFQEYIRKTVGSLAALRPDFMMVDDDFRMISWRNCCFCELHRRGFAAPGESAADFAARVDASPELARRYDAWLQKTLVDLAAVIREAADTTDAAMPISFCTCVGDYRYANAIINALNPRGGQKVVRLNNSRYLTDSYRGFALRMYQTAVQVAAIDAPEIWAEPDTYPQNRYSTGARAMHSHLTASIWEGCTGGKFWISRFHTYEPESGRAYREILSRYSGFYRAVAELKPRPRGIAAPLPEEPFFNWNPLRTMEEAFRPLAAILFGRMGLVSHFARRHDGAKVLTGSEAAVFSDRELREFLSSSLMLDGDAAIEFCRRGFAAELGVKAEPWSAGRISGELLNGSELNEAAAGAFIVVGADSYKSVSCALLTPLSGDVRIHSSLVTQSFVGARDFKAVAPGLATFVNPRGGKIVVFAGSMVGSIVQEFFFLNESRRKQLIGVLKWLDAMEVYLDGDAEVYLKYADTTAGRALMLLNLSADPIDEFDLVFPHGVPDVLQRLNEDGIWEPVKAVRMAPDRLHVCRELPTMLPEVIRIPPESRR